MITALLLIDHGSRRAESNATLACIAALVESRLGDDTIVAIAHMDLAEPTVENAMASCVARGAGEVIARPFMLADGRHASSDIPAMVRTAAEALGIPYRVTGPLGAHGLLADIVLQRCGLRDAETVECSGDPATCRVPTCPRRQNRG